MAVTPDGTPYVEPGDAISAYPVVSQELAAVIDSLRLLIPVGTIAPYAGKVTAGAPEGWLPCDGKAYARPDFPDLYTIMSDWLGEWGGFPSGNSARFYVPDLRGRSPIGAAAGLGGVARDWALGERWGDKQPGRHTHHISFLNDDGGYGVFKMTGSTPQGYYPSGPVNIDNDQRMYAKPNHEASANGGDPQYYLGEGRNYQPSTGVNFIVYTGTTTTGKNSTGEQLPDVTTRMMIEARLEEAGIGEEEIEMLREQLKELERADA